MFYSDEETVIIWLVFYQTNPESFKDKICSDIATYYQGYFFETIYAHVELITYDSEGILVSFSATYEDGVRKCVKQFRRKGHKEFRRIQLTISEHNKCLDFLERVYAKDVPYDYGAWARFNCITDCIFSKKSECYFCSELVCKALIDADVLEKTWKPRITTTQMLFEKFEDFKVPTKEELKFLERFYTDEFDMT